MSDNTSPPPPSAPPVPHTTGSGPNSLQIRVISHSGLFYWWPIWFFGILFALWSFADGHRMAIVPKDSILKVDPGANTSIISMAGKYPRMEETVERSAEPNTYDFKTHVSIRPWMGPIFLSIFLVVMLITNVPLRGLWSLVIIISFILVVVIFSLMQWWDTILGKFADLHIYINMGGYFFIGLLVLIAWLTTVFVFDKRAYMIFTPGQIKVCEEIGGRERVFDTTGMTVEKQRDDWFRHIILGFGSGDLTVKTAGADRQQITMPNVAFIGFKIGAIERLLRERKVN